MEKRNDLWDFINVQDINSIIDTFSICTRRKFSMKMHESLMLTAHEQHQPDTWWLMQVYISLWHNQMLVLQTKVRYCNMWHIFTNKHSPSKKIVHKCKKRAQYINHLNVFIIKLWKLCFAQAHKLVYVNITLYSLSHTMFCTSASRKLLFIY